MILYVSFEIVPYCYVLIKITRIISWKWKRCGLEKDRVNETWQGHGGPPLWGRLPRFGLSDYSRTLHGNNIYVISNGDPVAPGQQFTCFALEKGRVLKKNICSIQFLMNPQLSTFDKIPQVSSIKFLDFGHSLRGKNVTFAFRLATHRLCQCLGL